jgi:hypothetical protein
VWYRYSQANNPIVWIDKDNQQYVLYIDRNGKQQKVPFDSAQKLGINPNNLPVTNNPNFVKKNISNWNFNDQSTSLATNNPDSQSLFTPDFTRYQSQQGYNLMNQGYSLDQAKQIVNSQEFIQQYNASKNSSLGSQSNRNNPIVWIDKDNKQYVRVVDNLKDKTYHEVAVQSGLQADGGLVEIISGLSDGQQIVTYMKR